MEYNNFFVYDTDSLRNKLIFTRDTTVEKRSTKNENVMKKFISSLYGRYCIYLYTTTRNYLNWKGFRILEFLLFEIRQFTRQYL
jgi:hypothetical protein